jgi:N-acetyl-alpha-D-glucosaminyl L-malate synthase BshA
VDLNRFHPQESAEREKRVRPRLIHISNFRPVKDTQSMARIFVDLRKQMDAELWLVGDGPEMPAVKETFQRSGVEDDVCYWGLQPDVAPILSQADLLLLTSLNESFSLVALEAMACGVPVVSTNVGGLPEVVLHDQTGGLFSQGDHHTAVKLALRILSDPVRHQQMRRAAIRHAQQFDPDRIIPRYEALYRELLYHRSGRMLKLRQPSSGFPVDVVYPQV